MKLKKIFIISILVLSVFLIYLTTMDKKIYFLALGDSFVLNEKGSYTKLIANYFNEKNILEEYRYEFIEDDLRITDLTRNIEDNKSIEVNGTNKTLKNALIKADLITLSIGNEELIYKIKTENEIGLYNYIDEMIEDMEKLLKIMREYCKEDIFVLGYLNTSTNKMDKYVKYANEKLITLTKKYEMQYINLEELKENKNNFNLLGLTSSGQKKVYEILIPLIEKQVLED